MYAVIIEQKALRELAKLPAEVQARLRPALLALADEPRPPGCKKLSGRGMQWRIRRGDYRIVYEIEDAILRVLVVGIGHRSDIYQ